MQMNKRQEGGGGGGGERWRTVVEGVEEKELKTSKTRGKNS